MLAILELHPRVQTAADVAREETLTAPLTSGSSRPWVYRRILDNHWQEEGRVSHVGPVSDLVPRGIIKAQDLEPAEITPAVVEITKPIIDYAIDRCTQVQLVAQGVKLNSEVNILRQ